MEPLNVSKAAKVSGLSVATIKRKIASGDLKSTPNKQGWNQIEHSDLMKFIATANLEKTRSGATAHKPLKGSQSDDAAQFRQLLELNLSEAKARIKELEIKLEKAQDQLQAREAELRAVLSGGVTKALTRWIKGK